MFRRNTLILVGVFVALVAITLLIQRNNEQNPALPESGLPTQVPPTYLFDFTSESVVGVLIEGQDGQVTEMRKDSEGTWSLSQPPTLPDGTDQTAINSAVGQVGTVRVLNELANPLALDVIGLDVPAYVITFTLDSGNVTEIQVGSASPTGNGYYVLVDNASPKLVDKFFFDTLTGYISAPPILPTPVLSTTSELTPTLTIVPAP
jgi:hypothetical protein